MFYCKACPRLDHFYVKLNHIIVIQLKCFQLWSSWNTCLTLTFIHECKHTNNWWGDGRGGANSAPVERLWGNVEALSLILLKLRAVSVHRDVTLKSPVLTVDFSGLQILNIPSSAKILSSQAQKRDPADDGANISTADGCQDSQHIMNITSCYC